MPLFFAFILALIAGLGLQKLISYGVVLPSKPSDYGRIWSGWVVLFATLSLLTGFLIDLDVDSFALWAVIGLGGYGGGAYIAGCLYGKYFATKRKLASKDQAP